MNAGTRSNVPRALGYRMPAEWEEHEGTWIAWPHNRGDWPGKFATIPWAFVEMVRCLHVGERVRIIVKDDRHEQRARRMLSLAHVDLAAVDFFHIATDRSWTRDFAPLIITKFSRAGGRAAVKWRFTAWAKYDNYAKDEAAGQAIAKRLRLRTWRPQTKKSGPSRRVVLEGGSVDVNGHGCVLTSEECLLSADVQARNPSLTKEDYEHLFSDYLGAPHTVWIPYGIEGDDTHGHVDDLARFADERTIVAVTERDRSSQNYERLRENFERLRVSKDAHGHRFRVVSLPLPERRLFDGIPLPMSYANFYIGNRAVLVPTFNNPCDREALNTLANVFGRDVVGIYAGDLVWGFGTIHCLTQQEPK